jgi:hypothetical protein
MGPRSVNTSGCSGQGRPRRYPLTICAGLVSKACSHPTPIDDEVLRGATHRVVGGEK